MRNDLQAAKFRLQSAQRSLASLSDAKLRRQKAAQRSLAKAVEKEDEDAIEEKIEEIEPKLARLREKEQRARLRRFADFKAKYPRGARPPRDEDDPRDWREDPPRNPREEIEMKKDLEKRRRVGPHPSHRNRRSVR